MISQGRLDVPTLIVWGYEDLSAPLKLGMDLLAVVAPVVEHTRFHVFNRAGHYVFREHAAELNHLIVSFVAETVSE